MMIRKEGIQIGRVLGRMKDEVTMEVDMDEGNMRIIMELGGWRKQVYRYFEEERGRSTGWITWCKKDGEGEILGTAELGAGGTCEVTIWGMREDDDKRDEIETEIAQKWQEQEKAQVLKGRMETLEERSRGVERERTRIETHIRRLEGKEQWEKREVEEMKERKKEREDEMEVMKALARGR